MFYCLFIFLSVIRRSQNQTDFLFTGNRYVRIEVLDDEISLKRILIIKADFSGHSKVPF